MTLLAFAAAVTLVIDPSFAWGNIGWELSFAAFAGVMIFAPLIEEYFFADKKPNMVRRILIETTSAQVFTLPIILSVFGQLSVVAIVSNLLVLPLVPIAMLLVFASGLGGLLLGVVWIISWPTQLLLTYMVRVVELTSSLSWSQVQLNLPTYGVFIWYFMLIAVCIYIVWVTKYNLRSSSIIE